MILLYLLIPFQWNQKYLEIISGKIFTGAPALLAFLVTAFKPTTANKTALMFLVFFVLR